MPPPSSKIRSIVSFRTFCGFFISSAAEKKLNKILWVLFFCCMDIDGTKHYSKQSDRKRGKTPVQKPVEHKFQLVRIVLLRLYAATFVHSLRMQCFTSALWIYRQSIPQNQNKERKEIKNLIHDWSEWYRFSSILFWNVQCELIRWQRGEWERVLSENIKNIKLEMNFDCNGINRMQHLNLCHFDVIFTLCALFLSIRNQHTQSQLNEYS